MLIAHPSGQYHSDTCTETISNTSAVATSLYTDKGYPPTGPQSDPNVGPPFPSYILCTRCQSVTASEYTNKLSALCMALRAESQLCYAVSRFSRRCVCTAARVMDLRHGLMVLCHPAQVVCGGDSCDPCVRRDDIEDRIHLCVIVVWEGTQTPS